MFVSVLMWLVRYAYLDGGMISLNPNDYVCIECRAVS